MLSHRTGDYRDWVEASTRNHRIPIEWAEKGLRKEDHALPALRCMEKRAIFGVYFIFKSMEQGRTFRITAPKYPTQDPHHRILAMQRSRFPHYYFYIRHEVLGPIIVRVASLFPFDATYWLNGHSFIQRERERTGVGFHKNDNAFLAVDDVEALQAAAHRLSPYIIRKQLDYWTLILGPKFSKKERGQMNLSRFYAIAQIEYSRNFIFTPLPHPQDLRAKLRDRPLAADGQSHQRDLRRPDEQTPARKTGHRDRPDRARTCFVSQSE